MPSRVLIRALLAIFTAIVLLLSQSAFMSDAVSVSMRGIIVALALLAYFRPHYALLALAAIAPLGQAGSRALDSQMRGAEALVLAFLAGALVRGWTLQQFRSFPATRLQTAAAIFGLIVAASCVEQLWFLQVQTDLRGPFVQRMMSYASGGYLTSLGEFAMIFSTMLLLEGLALLLYTAHVIRLQPAFALRLVVALMIGAAGAALFNIGYVAMQFAQTEQPRARLVAFFAHERWTIHIGDVNAAGAYFAMAMVIAFASALKVGHRRRMAWLAAGFILGTALWMTRSRTAIVAVLLLVLFLIVRAIVGRGIGVAKTMAVTAALAVSISVVAWALAPPEFFGAGAADAITIRWLFLGTTWRMLQSEPLFGVGIDQYALWSFHFAAPEMFNHYSRENAHNNFAQVAGELGVIGLASFVSVLAMSLWRRQRDQKWSGLIYMPVVAGVAVFIVTWLGNHPLLVPEVAYPFWIALGVAAAPFSVGVAQARASLFVALALALLLISIPLRVDAKAASVNADTWEIISRPNA